MNQRERIIKRKQNWRKYHVPGQPAYKTLKQNGFSTTSDTGGCGDLHEHTKLAVCRKLKSIGHTFITEAAKNQRLPNGLERRVDVVDLDTGIEYEIETTKARAGRFKEISGDIVVVLVEGMTLEQAIIYAKNQVVE